MVGYRLTNPFSFNPFSTLSQPKSECVQQVVDSATLLDVVTKIVNDIPNICLSKFKLCGGFVPQPAAPGGPPPVPPPIMDWARRSGPDDDDDLDVEVVEEVTVDENGNTTFTKSKPRSRRSVPEEEPSARSGYHDHGYGAPAYSGYGGGYGPPAYEGYGGGYPGYGKGYSGYGGHGHGHGYGGYGHGYGGYGYPGYGVNLYDYVQLSQPYYRSKNHLYYQNYYGKQYYGDATSSVWVN